MTINIRKQGETIFTENSLEFQDIWDPILGITTYLSFKKWSKKKGDRLRIVHIENIVPENEAEERLKEMLEEECRTRMDLLYTVLSREKGKISLNRLWEETGVCEKTIIKRIEMMFGKEMCEFLEIEEDDIVINTETLIN